jgi:hypothetical protein
MYQEKALKSLVNSKSQGKIRNFLDNKRIGYVYRDVMHNIIKTNINLDNGKSRQKFRRKRNTTNQ